MKTLLKTTIAAACVVAATATPASAQAVTIQGATHNGSLMAMLSAPGGGLVVQYARPRPDLNGVVMPGTVLVRGHWQGPTPQVFVGEAFVFSRLCGAIPYPVRGTIDQSQVLMLFGGAPQFDTSCRIVGYDINSQIAFGPLPTSQGRIAGYRIGEDQSGGNGTILQSVGRWRGRPKNTSEIWTATEPSAGRPRAGEHISVLWRNA